MCAQQPSCRPVRSRLSHPVMPTSIHTRWKILVNLDQQSLSSIGKLFNSSTAKSFVRSLGGRSSLAFSPTALTCTSTFYDLLRSTIDRLGFQGRKLPLVHSEQGRQVNFRFRLYGRVLTVEVERSSVQLGNDPIEQTLLWAQGPIAELTLSVLGLISNPVRAFSAATQRPKVFTCSCLVSTDDRIPDVQTLVRLLTRHKSVTGLVVSQVVEKNRLLQSDSSMLLVDRQGVVAAIPAELASDQTAMRRYPAAANMLEVVAAVERMVERGEIGLISGPALAELASWFRNPQMRFKFSTSSLLLWQCVANEFGMSPSHWNEIEKTTMKSDSRSSHVPKALIITAIEAEASPSLKRLKDVSTEVRSNVYWNRGTVTTTKGPVDVYVCSVGVGNAKAIMNTTRLMELLRPDLTVFCGIAGGRKEAQIGNVVMANLVYNYESGKERPEGFAPRPRMVALSHESESLATAFLSKERATEKSYEVFLKPIACGEKVVATTRGSSAAVIDSTYGDALAIEMEGFGFLSALERSENPVLLVRGISDRLDKKGETENHDLAIENATDLVFRLIDFFAAAKPVS